MEKNTEVMTLHERFPIIDPMTNKEILDLSKSNLGSRSIEITHLDRLQCPTGGGLSFELATLEGSASVKHVTGFIVAWREIRLLYEGAFGEGGGKKVPKCKSLDGYWGIGDPGGDCEHCPLAQFGSDPKGGRGQACKQVRQILFLREGEIVPNLVNVPPTSLKNARQYFLRLLSARVPYWGILTNLSLERTQNAEGTSYARMLFSSGQRLNEAERALMRPYAENMANLLKPLDVEVDDYEGQQQQGDIQPDTQPDRPF
jgi:hypothetical protein